MIQEVSSPLASEHSVLLNVLVNILSVRHHVVPKYEVTSDNHNLCVHELMEYILFFNDYQY